MFEIYTFEYTNTYTHFTAFALDSSTNNPKVIIYLAGIHDKTFDSPNNYFGVYKWTPNAMPAETHMKMIDERITPSVSLNNHFAP